MTELPLEAGGILRVDKPVGPTSHDAVAAVRRALKTRRVGHTGTLDPFASGLLLVCVGPATRLAEYLTALPKTYHARLRLGAATDTDDHTGRVLSESDAWRGVTPEALAAALAAQQGEVEQLPPLYSAKKVGGERAYAAARRGEAVERRAVRVTIHRIELLGYQPPEADFLVECSSGTYIRAIARDAGEALGVGAHLTALRRTRVGVHAVDDAVPLERVGEVAPGSAAWVAPADAVAHLPRRVVEGAELERLAHGGGVRGGEGLAEGGAVALLSAQGALLAIGEAAAEGWVRPRKVFL